MTPAVEALAAAPAAAPSLLGAALRMVGALVLLGVSKARRDVESRAGLTVAGG